MEGFTSLFVTVLDMSTKAIFPILYVLLGHYGIRLPNARRKWAYLLWIVVALRLMIPAFPQIDINSTPFVHGSRNWIDILPQSEDYEHRTVGKTLALREGDPNYEAVLEAGAEPIIYGGSRYVLANGSGTAPAMTVGDLFPILTLIWLVGMGVMVLWNIIAMLRLHKKLEEAVPIEDGVYICDHIQNAFITGIGYYDIYLPSNLSPEQRSHVLAHERVHIQHSDPFFRALAFVLLCIHWFNPFVWLAYHHAMNDMEATCDEEVFVDMNEEERASYAQTLLELSTGSRPSVVAPLSFGETHLEQRIKHIFAYKAPGNASMLGVLIIIAYVFGNCLTDPATDSFALLDNSDQIPKAVMDLAAERSAGSMSTESIFFTYRDEIKLFAAEVYGEPVKMNDTDRYPPGVRSVKRELTHNGVAVIFYTAEDKGFYYIQYDPPIPADVGVYSEFDEFLETVQTDRIMSNWYSFAP